MVIDKQYSEVGDSITSYRLPVTDYMPVIHLTLFLLFFQLTSTAQTSQSVNSNEAIDIGGIKQWISIKGSDNHHPVLLFLHGGPGNSAMPYAEKFTSELQKHFVVVMWDQRESGKTAELNPSEKALTVSLMESDALEVIHYLLKRFKQDKIYLMGHSWGGFLGLKVAADHPELLNGYLAVSPMINQPESERLALEWMINKAKEDHNQQALDDLAKVKIPFENPEQLYYHRSWLAQMMGNKPPARDFVETWGKKWLALFNEASEINFFTYAPSLRCPVYFLIGRKDYQTNFKLAEDYYNVVKADKKRLFWFTDSGHSPNVTEPAKFQEIIITEILSEKEK